MWCLSPQTIQKTMRQKENHLSPRPSGTTGENPISSCRRFERIIFPVIFINFKHRQKKVTQPSPDPPRNSQEPLTPKRQWANMRVFYSGMLLWPSKEWYTTELEGDSPLFWTMLHPPLAETRLKTYTWDGNLDNFMPWSEHQTDSVKVRPPLILHAMWNIRRGADSPKAPMCIDNSLGSTHSYHVAPATPTKHPSPIYQV